MHTRRELLQGVAAAAMAARMNGGGEQSVPRRVLLVDLDDIGRDLFVPAKMPQLCSLASLGLQFSTFWAAPLCSIFRARVLTGCDASRPANYVGENVAHDGPFSGPVGPWITYGMPGTKTMHGKVHTVGTPSNPADQWPACMVGANRFDVYTGSHANLSNDGYSYVHWNRGWAFAGGASGAAIETQYATNSTYGGAYGDVLDGIDFIRVSFNGAHQPLQTPPPDDEPPGTNYTTGGLDNMLKHLDYRVSLLVSAAIAEGYLVLVCCDNGTSGAGKGDTTEAGINTPCFAVGFGVPQGVSDRLIQATDLFATVRELRGAQVIPTPDACSFADLFGFAGSAPRSFVTCSTYPGLGQAPNPTTWVRCARDTRYKLVGDGGSVLFWDLQTDPYETNPITPTTQRELAAFAALQAALPA